MIRKSIPLFTMLLETPVRSPLLVFICCLTHVTPRFSTFQRRENKSPRGEVSVIYVDVSLITLFGGLYVIQVAGCTSWDAEICMVYSFIKLL